MGLTEEAAEGRIPKIRAVLPFHHKGHLLRGVGADARGPPDSTRGQRRELPSENRVPEATAVRGRNTMDPSEGE